MNIKKRLIISNTLMVVIPIIITIAAAATFLFVSTKLLGKDVGYSNIKRFAQVRAELFNIKSDISKQRAGNLEESSFQESLRQSLSAVQGEYILTKGDNIIAYPKTMNKIDAQKAFEAAKDNSLDKNIIINNISYILEAEEVLAKDGTNEKVILLAPIDEEVFYFKEFIIFSAIVFVISVIATNIFMSYEFSKRILSPIKSLKNAVSEISIGNLEREIVEEGDKEIKELCHDLEFMRIQLKDSIDMKIKYDDNRKMLISSISHDLKTPITSIKGYVEGILDGIASTPEKVESYLKTIYSKAEHVDVMIDDLLLYSKLDLNQLPFNFEKTDIVEYLSYCLSETEPELLKTNIKISFSNDLKQPKLVMLDRERMRRVIMNIIDNSRKYMDKPLGEIILNLRETNSSIIVEVRDNGRGIDSEDINKIFDRFYRADAARSGAKGSGLGLAIAKQIVEGHKGRIWAVSHGNEGTSIVISLTK
jgi:signal transduction histidine kinase